jgi:Ca2+/Na+ antiporter
MYIGAVTFLIGEIATALGCVCGIKEEVTAITFVALGTSLPDTFASMTAAKTSDYADSAIGNVTGSNSVNVFLGLGLPWTIAAIYTHIKTDGKEDYKVPSGALVPSVIIFLIVAVLCFIILILRRCIVGGELGGPSASKYASAGVCIFLWFVYITVSTLNSYSVISLSGFE